MFFVETGSVLVNENYQVEYPAGTIATSIGVNTYMIYRAISKVFFDQ